MAAVVLGGGVNTTTDATSFTTTAFTPAANDLLVVFAYVTTPGTGVTLTSSASGETFSLVRQVPLNTSSTNNGESFVYVSDALCAAVSRQITFTNGTVKAAGCNVQAYRVSGMSRAGLSAILQSASSANQASGTVPVLTFSAPTLTANAVITRISGSSTTPDGPLGWTLRNNLSYGTPATRNADYSRDNGHAESTITWAGGSSSLSSLIGVELDTSDPNATASPDKSAALTSASATGARGSLGVSRATDFTGVSASGDVGAVTSTQEVGVTLLGVSGTAAVGGITASQTATTISGFDATGGTISEPGDGYRYWDFLSSGDLVVTTEGEVEYLIAAGGAGGTRGGTSASGGAGAGGLRTGTLVIPVGTHAATIGAGGTAGNTSVTTGGAGGNSSLGSLLSVIGGGRGAGSGFAGASGGSGGGGSSASSGLQPPGAGTAGQGFAGGVAFESTGVQANRAAGGGGGSGSVGAAASSGVAGNGGLGTNVWGTEYAGGGGGSSHGTTQGLGSAGGGDGALNANGGNARPNSGSGGGSASNGDGGMGGSGILRLRVALAGAPAPNPDKTSATTGTTTTSSVGTAGVTRTTATTGTSATGAAGATGVTRTTALTGTSATGSARGLGVTRTTATTGTSATGAAGDASPGQVVSTALTSTSTTGAAGSVTTSQIVNRALTGASTTASPGTITGAQTVSRAITGGSAAGEAGSVTANQFAGAALTGVSATGQRGSVTTSQIVNRALSGESAVSTVGGTGAGPRAIALQGVSVTAARGDITGAVQAPIVAALTGVAATTAVGNTTTPKDVVVSEGLLGNVAFALAGSVGVSISATVALVGSQAQARAGSPKPLFRMTMRGHSVESVSGVVFSPTESTTENRPEYGMGEFSTLEFSALPADDVVRSSITGNLANALPSSVAPTRTVRLSSVSATASPGLVRREFTRPLSFVAAEVRVGTASAARAVSLTSATATATAGSVTTSNEKKASLTGVSSSASVRPVGTHRALEARPASTTAAAGDLDISIVTEALAASIGEFSGSELSVIEYSAEAGGPRLFTVGITSVAATAAAGRVSHGREAATGVEATTRTGETTPVVSKALTGVSTSGQGGSVRLSPTLQGVQAASGAGSVGVQITKGVTGANATAVPGRTFLASEITVIGLGGVSAQARTQDLGSGASVGLSSVFAEKALGFMVMSMLSDGPSNRSVTVPPMSNQVIVPPDTNRTDVPPDPNQVSVPPDPITATV